MLIFIIKTPFKYNLNQEKRQNIPLRLSPVVLLESFTTIACGRGRLKKMLSEYKHHNSYLLMLNTVKNIS